MRRRRRTQKRAHGGGDRRQWQSERLRLCPNNASGGQKQAIRGKRKRDARTRARSLSRFATSASAARERVCVCGSCSPRLVSLPPLAAAAVAVAAFNASSFGSRLRTRFLLIFWLAYASHLRPSSLARRRRGGDRRQKLLHDRRRRRRLRCSRFFVVWPNNKGGSAKFANNAATPTAAIANQR